VNALLHYVAGALFALGLGLSGMTNPEKVQGFLNLAGDWDPSLAFVMLGAIAVHGLSLPWILSRERPTHGPRFRLPNRTDIDGRLIGGSMLFGAGWGLAGYCPGPGIVSAAGLQPGALVFFAALVGGMLLEPLGRALLAEFRTEQATS